MLNLALKKSRMACITEYLARCSDFSDGEYPSNEWLLVCWAAFDFYLFTFSCYCC